MGRDDPNTSYELISEYRKGDRYMTLRFDPGEGDRKPNYFYTGTGCGGGYGYDVDRQGAFQQFAAQVASDRVKLEHVAGEKVEDLFVRFTEGKPMTTAEFKRRMVKGSRWRLSRPGGGSGAAGWDEALRTVVHVQSQDFASLRDGHGETRSNWTWMQFVKSERLRELDGGAIVILDPRTGGEMMRYTPAE